MKRIYLFAILALFLLAACGTVKVQQPMSNLEAMSACETPVLEIKPELSNEEIEIMYYEQGYSVSEILHVDSQEQAMEIAKEMKACLVIYPANPYDTVALFAYRTSKNDLMPFLHRTNCGNANVQVVAVRAGSIPANHGLLKGDIINAINGVAVGTTIDLNPMFHYGQNNTMEIIRDGQSITLEMFIPDYR